MVSVWLSEPSGGCSGFRVVTGPQSWAYCSLISCFSCLVSFRCLRYVCVFKGFSPDHGKGILGIPGEPPFPETCLGAPFLPGGAVVEWCAALQAGLGHDSQDKRSGIMLAIVSGGELR